MKNYLDSIDREALRARADQMLGYANEAKDCAGRWTNYAVGKAQGFSLFDFAVFETCLLSLGLWLGSCFSKFFKKIRGALFVLFAASWLYLLWRIFFDEEE
ncbi:MAG: hypothetical protein ACOYIE_04450 [Agathobaculum sp.]|jgi:hypothetical protein|uniref:hypothetical protein n=1 Tax=Agathobaculum sp. TaxID=2048138 RepID=UPI003D93530D